jgi:hypothetical protein
VLGHQLAPRTRVVHRDRMGGFYKLVSLRYRVDRVTLYERTDEHGLELENARPVVDAPLPAGKHTLAVEAVYRGSGWPFVYVEGYRYKVESSTSFIVGDIGLTEVTVTARERGSALTTSPAERPVIEYGINDDSAPRPR